jgi:two-component system CheB/CheR fusion protein
LHDEVEQLRTALEAAHEENAQLLHARDQLLLQLADQARDLHERPDAARAAEQVARQSETEEELRVAFEELQVLTEELEVANSGLQETNRELDRRIEQRMREIGDAHAALQASEASFRAITDLVPDLLFRTDRSGAVRWYNRRWYEYTGQDPELPPADSWSGLIHPRDRATSRISWQAAVLNGESYAQEHRVMAAGGGYRWFLVRAEPQRDARGEVVHWFGSLTDIQEQKLTMEALQQSELRFRSLVENVPQLVWRAVDGGKWTWSSPQWSDYTGLTEEASRQRGWLRALHPDDRDAAKQAWAKAVAGEPLEIEARIYHVREKRYRHFRTRATALTDAAGNISEWFGTSTDVDDLLELQDRQATLLAELQHRVRNLLTLIRSVVRHSFVDGQSAEDYVQHLEGRLDALARTQVLLTRKTNAGIDLEDMVRDELVAQVASDDRMTVAGPRVVLAPKAAEILALALHELATNSLKYGALDRADATIAIAWSIARRGGVRWLNFSWHESGVPIVEAAPRRFGFGTELITQRVPYELRGRGELSLEPGGLRCTIAFPLLAGESILQTGAAARAQPPRVSRP